MISPSVNRIFQTVMLVMFTATLFAQADSSRYYFQKGLEEKNNKRYAVADKLFDKAIKFSPGNIETYIEKGRVNLEMRKLYDAQLAFNEAYKIDPGNEEAIRQLTDIYFNNRQYNKALEFAEKCKSCKYVDFIRGMVYYNTEDYGQAMTSLEKAVKMDPANATAAYTLARTYLELEQEKKAIPSYLNAIALDSSRSNWIYELGLIYYNQGNYQNAIQFFEKAASAGYNKGNDFVENLGFAQLYAVRTDQGLATLQTIMDRKPNNKELIGNIASALYETKQYDNALAYYEKLLHLNPNDASALYMAGMTFQQKGEKEKGQKICDKAISMDPSLAKNRQKKDLPMGL